jgi:hypothetical protein
VRKCMRDKGERDRATARVSRGEELGCERGTAVLCYWGLMDYCQHHRLWVQTMEIHTQTLRVNKGLDSMPANHNILFVLLTAALLCVGCVARCSPRQSLDRVGG